MTTASWPSTEGLVNPRVLLLRAALMLLLLSTSLAAHGQYTWQITYSFNGGPKTGIAVTGDSTLITAVPAGVLCSSNQGHTWHLALRAHAVEAVYATRNGQLLAGGLGKVYRSLNKGASWDSVRLATALPVVTFVETPQGELLLGTGAYTREGSVGTGVFYSDDQGGSWRIRSTGFGAGRFVNQLAVDRQGRVYAAMADQDPTHQPGLYMSTDVGQHWTYLPFRLSSPDFPDPVRVYEVTALAVSPQDSLQCSFSGGYATIGVMGNFAKAVKDVATATIGWTEHGGSRIGNWWFRTPLNALYFAPNGYWYSSRIGSSDTGGTLVSSDQGRSWRLITVGLGVGFGGLREPQQFAATPDGNLFMVQNDDKVYWMKTSRVTANQPRQTFTNRR